MNGTWTVKYFGRGSSIGGSPRCGLRATRVRGTWAPAELDGGVTKTTDAVARKASVWDLTTPNIHDAHRDALIHVKCLLEALCVLRRTRLSVSGVMPRYDASMRCGIRDANDGYRSTKSAWCSAVELSASAMRRSLAALARSWPS